MAPHFENSADATGHIHLIEPVSNNVYFADYVASLGKILSILLARNLNFGSFWSNTEREVTPETNALRLINWRVQMVTTVRFLISLPIQQKAF